MERDLSSRRMYGEEETPEGAAGSEFGKKQREEARRKKFGIVTREFKVEDQPWILKVNGKAGRRCDFIMCGITAGPFHVNSDTDVDSHLRFSS